jgi:hypothetical protein
MKLTVFFLVAALTAGAQATTQHLPSTDAEKITDALRAGPNFITDNAIILDWPAQKGGEFRVLRKGTSEWTCLHVYGCFCAELARRDETGISRGPTHHDRYSASR